MVTVVKTPQGHKIIDQAVTAAITEDYVGDAVVTFAGHSLTTGDTVYITSDIDEYNGFWYVTTITIDTFKISEHSESDFVEYYQDADIEYYQTQPHDWSSIFLPIVYKATNTFWPTNSVDTARTVSSFSDDNGFTQVTLSGALRSSVKALEFVELSGMADEEYDGIWQIVEVISNSNVVLSLPYADDLSFSGATIQYYYNNYQVKVKIYSGLPASHPWYAKKPYAEVAELSLTPDENNEIMFSVADYIQGQVNIRNNPTLFSMPLNLDAFTGFYIATAETYDQSDNYSLYTTDPLFDEDDFEGYAIAGKLPFKNVYSGDYADYIYTSGSPALWLTNRARLLAVEGYYFDVSFIKNIIGSFRAVITKYVADYGISEEVQYTDQGIGVYRIPITPDVNYDSFCVQMYTNDRTEEVTVNPDPDDLSVYTQTSSGSEPAFYAWTLGATPSISMTDDGVSEFLGRAMSIPAGPLQINYDITINFTNTLPLPIVINIYFWLNASQGSTDNFSIVVYNVPIVGSGTANIVGSVIVTATVPRNWFDIFIDPGADEVDITINEISFGESTTEEVEVPGVMITEEICIDILETCEIEGGFTPETARRLTEDGGYRLLE